MVKKRVGPQVPKLNYGPPRYIVLVIRQTIISKYVQSGL